MIDKQLHIFYISYRLEGKVMLEWIEGINLRHAKEKILFKYPDASDLMDWTNEKEEDLKKYLEKVSQKSIEVEIKSSTPKK